MCRIGISAASALAGAMLLASAPAAADILVNISKSSQRMSVLVDGTARYNWKVSTGTKRYTTPSGVYKPQWLARKWRSKQYNNAPMPHAIFFHRGYAVHGTTEVGRLGNPASHGCVRLHPENAALLYSLVEKQMAQTRLVVSDDPLEAPGQPPKKKPSLFVAENETTPSEELARKSGAALAAVAIRASQPAEKEDAAPTEKSTRPAVRPPPVRVVRASRPGFHW